MLKINAHIYFMSRKASTDELYIFTVYRKIEYCFTVKI
jgi:hypothetical protein